MSKEVQDVELTSPIIKDGWMRKKSSRVNVWGDRYFVLRGATLFYYLKSTDSAAKGIMPLVSACKVSEIRSDIHKKRKQFIFKVIWPLEESEKEESKDGAMPADGEASAHSGINASGPNLLKPIKGASSSSAAKKKTAAKKREEGESKAMSSTKVAALAVGGVALGAVTAGVGLLAGLLVVGISAAAGGGAAAFTSDVKEYHLQLACDTYHEAEGWVFALENQIHALGGTAGHTAKSLIPYIGGLRHSSIQTSNAPPPEIRLGEVEDWVKSSKWRVSEVWEGLRIMEQVCISPDTSLNTDDTNELINDSLKASNSNKAILVPGVPPCMRVTMSINGSASDTFATIMNMPFKSRTGSIKSLRIVETIDYNSDIIHLVLQPSYVWPTWTSPRDLCLTRYWKNNSDGSFVICLDSSYHAECPLIDNHVRGELHGVYVIAPLKDGEDEDEQMECSLTFIGQYDPKGWVWETLGYQRAMLRELMFHVLDIRDCLDGERFIQVNFETHDEQGLKLEDSAMNGYREEDDASAAAGGSIASIPAPTLPVEYYTEPDPRGFRIRGATYMDDKVKVTSAPYLFRLICCDLFEVPGPTTSICSHPRNRVYRALQRNEDVWVFAVNIMIPGPPYLSFVAYFQGDKALLQSDTPFGRIAEKFFFGADDEYRNNRFKLIPKVVDGNMVVKMVVKDTPTLLGNKVKVHYNKGDNYFELDIDVGSSNVARNAVKISSGYSKILVVDMGFCLQGDEASELPEVMMGACELIHMDLSVAQRL